MVIQGCWAITAPKEIPAGQIDTMKAIATGRTDIDTKIGIWEQIRSGMLD